MPGFSALLRPLHKRSAVTLSALLLLAGSAAALPIAGSVTVKPYIVDPTGMAADPSINFDFAYANLIWNQVGIRFDNVGVDHITQANPAGGWNRYSVNTTLNTLANQPPGGFAYFSVPSYLPGSGVLASTWSQEDVNSTNLVNPNNMMQSVQPPVAGIVTNLARGGTDTIPHEFGHMLSNRYRWRRAESASATNTVHTGLANQLMLPNVQNPNPSQIWPNANPGLANIGHNIGSLAGGVAGQRVPFITACYNDSGNGTTAGTNLVSATRDQISVGIGNFNNPGSVVFANGTAAANFGWGRSQTINYGGNTWRVDETARRAPNLTESLSFFFSSSTALTVNDGLRLDMREINSLDGMYTGIQTLQATVVVWQDILSTTAPANVGTVLTLTTDYDVGSGFNNVEHKLTSLIVDIHPGKLTNIRDIQVTFTMEFIPAPGSFIVLAGVALVNVRRRRA